MTGEIIGDNKDGKILIELVDEANEVLGHSIGEPAPGAVLNGAEMRLYYDGVEKLREASRAVDEQGPNYLREAV